MAEVPVIITLKTGCPECKATEVLNPNVIDIIGTVITVYYTCGYCNTKFRIDYVVSTIELNK